MTCIEPIAEKLRQAIGAENVLFDEPLSCHTTFKIGGPAPLYLRPGSEGEIASCLGILRDYEMPFRFIGCGSDLLVADAGVDFAVIEIGARLSSIQVCDNCISVGAGATNKEVAEAACEAGLAGYEFASGIPGTIGGAAIMNAGAYGGQFSDVCTGVTCLDESGQIVSISAEDAQWGYRKSVFAERGLCVVAATLKLTPDAAEAIRERMDDLEMQRASKQPLELPSAGSTFKRPEGYFVGKLLQDAGLKGYQFGGAQVSPKHAGFVVNSDNATAADVLGLIEHIQAVILERDGVALEPEVRMWGF